MTERSCIYGRIPMFIPKANLEKNVFLKMKDYCFFTILNFCLKFVQKQNTIKEINVSYNWRGRKIRLEAPYATSFHALSLCVI